MGTLSDKLAYLTGTKDAIKSALIAKGQTVSSSDAFRNYAEKISAIPAGSGDLPSGISRILTGTFTPAEAISTYTVNHNSGVYPKAFLCILENPVNRNYSENHNLQMYYYQGFSGQSANMLYTGCMNFYISSTGDFARGGTSGAYANTTVNAVAMSSSGYFKPTVKNRITGETEPAVYRWYAIF